MDDSEINRDGYPIMLDGPTRLRALQLSGASQEQIDSYLNEREREARDRLREVSTTSPWPPAGTH